jgi:hypothetical protein
MRLQRQGKEGTSREDEKIEKDPERDSTSPARLFRLNLTGPQRKQTSEKITADESSVRFGDGDGEGSMSTGRWCVEDPGGWCGQGQP